jgi:superfamily II DNA or RNA helicase
MHLKIYKDGQLMRIRPIAGKVQQLLCDTLRYTRRKALMTKYERDQAGGKHIELIDVACYDLRVIGKELQLIANSGFIPRVCAALDKAKITYEISDVQGVNKTKVFEPVWSNVENFDFRPGQKDVLEALTVQDRGRVWWATGTGKSYIIPLICKLYPKANIVVTTKHKVVLEDIYKNLSMHLPSVGIYHSGRKVLDKRVMCYSAGCLQHANTQHTNILIADEVHELATDAMFEKLAQFNNARMYGLSANVDDRFDGADFELEGIFGPVIAKLTYQEGVANGMIVPIEVHWKNVILDSNPAANLEGVAKLRNGIWRNRQRNARIARDAQSFADAQVLITVKTFEHACHLKALLPDFTLVYAVDDREADIDKYIKWKLITADEPKMSIDRLERLKTMFEQGKLRKVIATTVWNRGVNFKELQVLIRADAGSSALDDTQIPGRLSRTTDKIDKQYGILIDYLDQFDDGFRRKASSRLADYTAHGWKMVMPGSEMNATSRQISTVDSKKV